MPRKNKLLLGNKTRRKNAFVKVSGDEFLNPAFLKWVRKKSKKMYTVICVGGGTQINRAFARRGFPVKKRGPMGRETKTLKQRQLQRNVLEENQVKLQDWLASIGIFVAVEIPIVIIATVLCPNDGDQMVRTAYLGFDELYIVTTTIERAKNKANEFVHLPKVSILYEHNGGLRKFTRR